MQEALLYELLGERPVGERPAEHYWVYVAQSGEVVAETDHLVAVHMQEGGGQVGFAVCTCKRHTN